MPTPQMDLADLSFERFTRHSLILLLAQMLIITLIFFFDNLTHYKKSDFTLYMVQ